MIILGIESSCDETGVGIIDLAADGTMTILADAVASSMDQHARFGGVVPEIASRAHLEAMQPVMHAALSEAGITAPDAVAATVGPGLAGALLVGASAAKAYAAAWGVPFYGVNHLGGHVAVANLEGEPLPHAIALLVSGGHTQLLEVTAVGKPMRELGSTLDDAAGEHLRHDGGRKRGAHPQGVAASLRHALYRYVQVSPAVGPLAPAHAMSSSSSAASALVMSPRARASRAASASRSRRTCPLHARIASGSAWQGTPS